MTSVVSQQQQQQQQQQLINSYNSVLYSSQEKQPPRPPVPGSERGAEVFREHGMGYISSTSGLKNNYSSRLGPPHQGPKMVPSPKATSESGASIGSGGGRERGFEPEGSADITPPFSESNSNNSTPAYLR